MMLFLGRARRRDRQPSHRGSPCAAPPGPARFGDGMQIDDAIDAFVGVLHGDPVQHGAEIIAERRLPSVACRKIRGDELRHRKPHENVEAADAPAKRFYDGKGAVLPQRDGGLTDGRAPELPEVETVMRGLKPVLEGRRIARWICAARIQALPPISRGEARSAACSAWRGGPQTYSGIDRGRRLPAHPSRHDRTLYGAGTKGQGQVTSANSTLRGSGGRRWRGPARPCGVCPSMMAPASSTMTRAASA